MRPKGWRLGEIAPAHRARPFQILDLFSSLDLQRSVVHAYLRSFHRDLGAAAVVDLDTEGRDLDLLTTRRLQSNPADAEGIIEQDAVAPFSLEHHFLVGRNQQHGRDLRHGAEPTTRPDRVIGITMLVL